MRKSHTIIILILSFIITAVTILLFFFLLKVIENKNQHASAVLETLKDKIQEKENATINASRLDELNQIQNNVNNYFVDKDKIDIFVNYLEDMGLKLGSSVSVESIELLEKSKDIISVKLSVGGTFGKVMNTISFLENIPYQINITQIYLSKDTKQVKNQKTQTWQANISFNILSLN